ncbi:hypothetical protein [Amylibacter sp. IMCC11727]|uniref:hypothetical protein n=1 Tax=Amylibacter sp. IMCC11727 TaxID=3039851 RepID=UPI00244E4ED7|nr:hypothetical protein [Amylibacter sp. IMCC11727]WGI22764.1 hypothetical protein QBD29_04915 [Amylibacter sp. IMCC11727]
MTFLRALILVVMAATLSACGGQSVWAPDEAVQKARYDSPEPAYLVLKTMINNRSGSGGHAALTINASQTVMYDPAGRWSHPLGPERNDVVFGMFPKLEENYDNWHARTTHHVVNQKIYVSEEVAEKALQLALAAGPSLDAQCTLNISGLLLQLEGFESLRRTYFPAKLMKDFAKLPGVQTTKVFDDDEGKN